MQKQVVSPALREPFQQQQGRALVNHSPRVSVFGGSVVSCPDGSGKQSTNVRWSPPYCAKRTDTSANFCCSTLYIHGIFKSFFGGWRGSCCEGIAHFNLSPSGADGALLGLWLSVHAVPPYSLVQDTPPGRRCSLGVQREPSMESVLRGHVCCRTEQVTLPRTPPRVRGGTQDSRRNWVWSSPPPSTLGRAWS